MKVKINYKDFKKTYLVALTVSEMGIILKNRMAEILKFYKKHKTKTKVKK